MIYGRSDVNEKCENIIHSGQWWMKLLNYLVCICRAASVLGLVMGISFGNVD